MGGLGGCEKDREGLVGWKGIGRMGRIGRDLEDGRRIGRDWEDGRRMGRDWEDGRRM